MPQNKSILHKSRKLSCFFSKLIADIYFLKRFRFRVHRVLRGKSHSFYPLRFAKKVRIQYCKRTIDGSIVIHAEHDFISRFFTIFIEYKHSSIFVKGERADFVLKASKRIGSYWMNVHTAKECGTSAINGAAMLNYKGNSENPAGTVEVIDQSDIDEIESGRLAVTTNPVEKCGERESLCAMDIQNIRKMPQTLTGLRMDVTLYLPINYKMQATELIGA